jgi:hypothetical protein
METIKIAGTDDTPDVVLDKDANKFIISGRSLPEDVASFYDPLLEWMDEYASEPLDKTEFEFKLEYFNTASSKMLLDILLKLEEMAEEGHEILVKWYYPEDDEDMQEAGEEYEDIVDIPFEHISYEEE